MEFLQSADFWIGLVKIVWINIILSGDNAVVIALAALEALSEAGVDVNWTVVLNSDEETGSYHSERAIRAAATGAAKSGAAQE